MRFFEIGWIGTRVSSWLAVLLLVCADSSCCLNMDVKAYPSSLGTNTAPRIAIWQGDARGTKFHSIATAATEPLADEDKRVSFDWPSDLSASLPKSIGSVAVLLDPSPSIELRMRVDELLRCIALANPEVSTSVTVCLEPLGEIVDGKALHEAVERLSKAAIEERARTSVPPWGQFDAFSVIVSLATTNSRVVLPNAAKPGEYFLVTSHLGYVELPLTDRVPVEIESVEAGLVLEGVMDGDCVLFVAPWNMPEDVAQSMGALMTRLTPQPRPGDFPAARWTEWPLLYSEFTSAESVRLALRGRIAKCACTACKSAPKP